MSCSHGFDRIFHPSDFTSASEIAFVHALKIALQGKASLQMMHIDRMEEADRDRFPSVKKALERWKILPEGSPNELVGKLGLEFSKLIPSSNDPVQACLNYFEVQDVDLIVLPVHQRDDLMRYLGTIVVERISERSKQRTLFIPVGRRGFISKEDGSVNLRKILIPMLNKSRSDSSIEFARKLTQNLGLESVSVTLVHMGSSESEPLMHQPLDGGWVWNHVRFEGDRSEVIVQVANDIDADLIVMTRDGPDRSLDGWRGTTSERVLRKAHCPVAVIPVATIVE